LNKEAFVAAGVRNLLCVRQFLQLFPDAENTIVEANRDFYANGWKRVNEWISRAKLYDRYVFWLIVAVELTESNTVVELEKPQLYVVEVVDIEKSRDEEGGPKWTLELFEIEEADWNDLVAQGGDINSANLDLTIDEPLERFSTFWSDCRPTHDPPAPEAIALKAPFRYIV
jgi:hypothetical protein